MFVLGSKSPRRKALLEDAGLSFEIIAGDLDESIDEKDPDKLVKKLSYMKALEIYDKNTDKWILSADTIVYVNGTVLEKPASKDMAESMIKMLSGQEHTVMTGFTVLKGDLFSTEIVTTNVVFRDLTDEEIKWYINTSEPYDKAGGYAIQGLGTFMVKGIKGSYSNVVGLPVSEVIDTLIRMNVIRREIGKERYVSF